MSRPKVIAQFGTFEVENYGDRLFPIILEKELAARLPPFKLELFSPLAKREGIQPILQKDGTATPCSADMIILGGGDIISFGTDITTDYDQEWHHVIGAHSACWAIPSIHWGPILWNAPGIPFPFTEEQTVLVRALASRADYLSVRDELSKNHLRQAGVQEDIEIVPDTALLIPKHFSLETLRPIAEKWAASLHLTVGKYLVFQAHSSLKWHIPEITRMLRDLSNSLQLKVLLLPIGYCHNDQKILSQIQQESGGSFQFVSDKLDCSGTAAIIAHAACFIGTSLHGNITAFAYGIPHLIYNAAGLKKLEGFSRIIQAPERLIASHKEIPGKKDLLLQIPSRVVYHGLLNRIESHFNKIANYILHLPSTSNKPPPLFLDNYLRLLHDHQIMKTKMRNYESSTLLREIVLCKQIFQRLKVLAASFSNHRFWLFRFGISILRLSFKNCRKIFKLLCKRFYILLETHPVKIIPLNEWLLALNSKGTSPAILYQIHEDLFSALNKPLISTILPICNKNIHNIKESINSMRNQYYNNWELCIASSCYDSELKELLEAYQKLDRRIKVSTNYQGPLYACSNSALDLAAGEYITLLSADDILSPDALYEMIRKINIYPEADFIYSDEDKLNMNGFHNEPYYKPDWCPDSFLSRNYLGRLALIRKELVSRVGGFRIHFEGAEDYDLFLRVTEHTDRIFHIPKILYHRRMHDTSRASREAGRRALNEAVIRRQWSATVDYNQTCAGCYTMRHSPQPSHKVSIIIPTKNQTSTIKNCIDSIYSHTTHKNFEIIVVSNNSTEQKLFSLLHTYKKMHGDRFHYYENNLPFNFSRLMNEAAAKAKGDSLLFLNNDTEVITPDWLQEMAGQSERTSIGAVGCKLLYFNNTIQHAGVVMGESAGRHVFVGEPRQSPGYFHHLNTVNNYSAVTAACLMCRRSVFNEVDGFDETLCISFNDIDFCLKLKERGYRNIYLPHVELYHYESLTRGSVTATKESSQQFSIETEIIRSRWGKYMQYDPCFSMHLSQIGNGQLL